MEVRERECVCVCGGVVITVTDSVYVSVGAVEANRLDNASDQEDLRTGRARPLTFTLWGSEPAAPTTFSLQGYRTPGPGGKGNAMMGRIKHLSNVSQYGHRVSAVVDILFDLFMNSVVV